MITINRESLLNKLNILEKAYNPKCSIPSLTFLKFSNGKMTMSNSYVTIITRVDILKENDNEDFKVLIPFKLFKDIITKLNDKDIELNLKENAIEIKANKSNYKLNTTDFNSYPSISINKLENRLIINPKTLKRIIRNTSISCAADEKRPILTGVNFKLTNDELKVFATDSFRLSYCNLNISNESEKQNNDFNLTIKSSDMNNLLKIIDDDCDLEIRYDNNQIVFAFDDVLYQTRLLDGNYPNCERLISNDFNYTCKIDREEFKNAIDRISIFSPKVDETNYSIIVLNIKNNNMEITSSNSQIGNAQENLDCKFEGEIKIACSSQYLIEALNTFDDEKVNIKLNESLRPFTITSDNNENLIQLLLPVKVEQV